MLERKLREAGQNVPLPSKKHSGGGSTLLVTTGQQYLKETEKPGLKPRPAVSPATATVAAGNKENA